MVQLDKVDNTPDSRKPVSEATQGALDLKANRTNVNAKIDSFVNNAPEALNTLNKLAQALGDDANVSSTVINSITTKAPKDNPVLTGTISVNGGIVCSGNISSTQQPSTNTQTDFNEVKPPGLYNYDHVYNYLFNAPSSVSSLQMH